jgi:hypothetical protein
VILLSISFYRGEKSGIIISSLWGVGCEKRPHSLPLWGGGKKVKEAKPFGRAGMGRKTQAKNGGEGCILFIDSGDIVE